MKTKIDWQDVFLESFPCPGATEAELDAAVAALMAPLTQEELQSIAQSQANPFPPGDPLYATYRKFDPMAWTIPNRPLPSSYISFLRWSNGGSFFNHERHFDPFFSCSELRQYLVGYHFPLYLPGSIPFALDGNGNVYYFDMRRGSHEKSSNEYPILFSSISSIRYENSVLVGNSFTEACAGDTNPADIQA